MSFRSHVLALASLFLGLFAAAPARAASMQKVNQSEWWGAVTGLPSYVNMYIYVPDAPAAKPPIVVAPHHCGGTASSTYSEMKSLETIADSRGFIMIFPEATGQNCWDAGSTRSLSHNGTGDTGAVIQMVKYTLSKYSGDAKRVYSVGGSSGGIMTEALLGVYPDVFMAGVSLMGVPCGCWAQGYNDVVGNPSSGTGQWSGACAGGTVTKTGAQWGDLVRSYYPGYTGHRPRLQHWHGTADTTLNYKNMAEDVKEWTNLLGLSETPTGMDTPKSGTTRQFWKNSCGYVVYETFSMSGVAHAVPFDGTAVAAYFGLDKAATEDPETAACGGGSGTGGAGGGSGGASGAAGTTGGRGGGGGRGGAAAGTGGTGGESTGVAGTSGAAGRGGAGAGGTTGSAGTSGGGAGGSVAHGGTTGQSGAGGNGGTTGQAGADGNGGTDGGGGAAGSGAAGSGAPAGHGGASGGGGSTIGDDSSAGCGCAHGDQSKSTVVMATFLLGALTLLLARTGRGARRRRSSIRGNR